MNTEQTSENIVTYKNIAKWTMIWKQVNGDGLNNSSLKDENKINEIALKELISS